MDTDSYFETRRSLEAFNYDFADPEALFGGDRFEDVCFCGQPEDLKEAQSRLLWHRWMIECIQGLLRSGRIAPGGELFFDCLNLMERQSEDIAHLRAWIAAQEQV